MESVSGEDDYESLPTHSLWIHITAGSAAGIMEHCSMYPMDSVKTRMQSLCAQCPERNCRTPFGGLMSIIKREGIMRPVRGVSAIATGAIPAHALYFTVYERLRYYLCNGKLGTNPMATGIAGVAATVCHDAVMNPAEVVKQRMQMFCCPYSSPLDCTRCVMRHEGLLAFYRSYPTQLVMNIPFHAIHFEVYEMSQNRLNPKKEYKPLSHLISGAMAGGVAAALTTPLDVCKTVLNTQERLFVVDSMTTTESLKRNVPHMKHPNQAETIRGAKEAIMSIYRHRGFTGFFGGLQARVLFQMPGTAISWSVYEFCKYLLRTLPLDSTLGTGLVPGSTVALNEAEDDETGETVAPSSDAVSYGLASTSSQAAKRSGYGQSNKQC